MSRPNALPRRCAGAVSATSAAKIEECGNRGDPEHCAKRIRRRRHEADRHQRAEESAHGIQRLPQSEAGAPEVLRRDIGDECVARRAADPLAEAVGEPCGDDGANGLREREDGLRRGREAVADHDEQLAPSQPVGECTGETLVMFAVASAMPSMRPTVSIEAPSAVAR
jgi:hypothetical protein